MGGGNLNSDSHACVAGTLPTSLALPNSLIFEKRDRGIMKQQYPLKSKTAYPVLPVSDCIGTHLYQWQCIVKVTIIGPGINAWGWIMPDSWEAQKYHAFNYLLCGLNITRCYPQLHSTCTTTVVPYVLSLALGATNQSFVYPGFSGPTCQQSWHFPWSFGCSKAFPGDSCVHVHLWETICVSTNGSSMCASDGDHLCAIWGRSIWVPTEEELHICQIKEPGKCPLTGNYTRVHWRELCKCQLIGKYLSANWGKQSADGISHTYCRLVFLLNTIFEA